MIVVAHVAFSLWKQADLEWPVLPQISQDGRMFFVGSLRNWGMSASVARNVAAGEARLPLRALMCTRCLSSTQSSESLRTMASPRASWSYSLICRGVSELPTANPKLLSPSEASRRR